MLRNLNREIFIVRRRRGPGIYTVNTCTTTEDRQHGHMNDWRREEGNTESPQHTSRKVDAVAELWRNPVSKHQIQPKRGE